MYIAVSNSVVKHFNDYGWHKRIVEKTVSIVIVYNFCVQRTRHCLVDGSE